MQKSKSNWAETDKSPHNAMLATDGQLLFYKKSPAEARRLIQYGGPTGNRTRPSSMPWKRNTDLLWALYIKYIILIYQKNQLNRPGRKFYQALVVGNHDAVLCCLGYYAPVKKATAARKAQYAAKAYPAAKNKALIIVPLM